MRVPLEWLREFVPVRHKPEELAHRLTMAGLEVTGIELIDGEPVLELEVTPNRADCLSIVGVAREAAAITGARFKQPRLAQGSGLRAQGKRSQPTAQSPEPRAKLAIRIEDRKGCPRYLGRLIEGVRIGPSPAWMQKRLVACGLRPINNAVDITNYVLLEWGQPLHAFDADRLLGGMILVRRAKAAETLVTLDGQTRALSPEMLVIADAKRPVAMAGVMGGLETQVTDATTRLVLESAWFEPILVRRTARTLGLVSESSYRFERGIDPVGVKEASRRASSLMRRLAGGRETAVQDVGTRRLKPVVVSLESSRVNRWLGASLPPAKASGALQRLGFSVSKPRRRRGKQAAGWRVQVPSFRRDIRQDVDLIEEIARLSGYDRLPGTLPRAPLTATRHADAPYARAQDLRQLCAGLGLWEVVTWALVSEPTLEQLGADSERVSLVNPSSRDHAILRPTLLVGILSAVSKNLAQGAFGVRVFELGNIFESSGKKPGGLPAPSAARQAGVRERLHLGIGIAGLWERSWQGARHTDLFRLKGIVEQLVDRSARQPLRAQALSLNWAEPGQGMRLWLGEQPLGTIGQVARRICEAYDCDEPVWFGELAADVLLERPAVAAMRTAPPPFPPVKRDLSFLVDKQVEYATLLALIQTVGSPLAFRVELIDCYTGPTVPQTQHSLTFSIEYRDPSRTLTADEADRLHARVIQALIERFGVQPR